MNDSTKQVLITTKSYDIAGHSIWRVFRQDIISRCLPFGWFGGGPNLMNIARLLFMHTCGGAIISLYVRSRLVQRVTNVLAKLRRKL